MKKIADREICDRTVDLVDEMVKRNNSSISAEMRRIDMTQCTYYKWKSYGGCPGAFPLSMMAENGYDVMYILTGKRKKA